ncbi:hypothetical protein V7S43_013413 [Phytophthora oleae]|uniref:Probable pectate lyase F n=1 Tax=Phytophthora oleae TaxID=2107226 RepID=A0ABD3F9C8_9STRA
MVNIRAAAAASLAILLGTLSATLADDSWGDMAQYTNSNSATQEQQSAEAPATWEASKQSDDENNDQKSDEEQKSDDDTTEAPSNVWTPAPSDGDSNEDSNSWTQAPASSSSGKSDGKKNDDDKSDTSPSSGQDENSSAQPPAPESDDKSDGDITDSSSESIGTSESSRDSWKQEPVASSGGSQTTGGGGTPSYGGGKVPDGTWPTSTGAVQFTEPHIIKAGEVFDGKMQTFDRSDITCSEGEGQKDTAVFFVEAGGTLKNAIIGKNQKEGVHCDDHDCTIDNVWWDDVCEDALSVKGGAASSVTTVTNCGARSANDKVVQHNGQGTVNIDGFYAENFGKLYRSCGTCGDIPRTVTVKNVYAVGPQVSVITVNKNYNDKATLSNIWVKTSDGKDEVKVCQWSQGGDNPSNVGDGPSPPLCQYSESDVHINQDVSQAGGSSPSTGSAPATSSDGSSTQWTQAPAPSTESSGNTDGDEDSTEAPATSSGGSQTTWSQPPAASSGGDNGGDDSTEAPAPSSAGSQTTGGETPSTGSQTTGGGSTPSSGGGKVPDGTWPTSTGTVQLAEAQIIKAGEVFDGKLQTFERSDVTCEGQTESGSSTAVFKLEAGATLKNAIIGKNQMEGVHCDDHDCTIDNVWWDDVCEDALSIKGGTVSSVSKIIGGGARYADDKVIQHNGYGSVEIDGFYGEDISKLYRSCGTCGDRAKKVDVSNVYVVNPGNAIVTVNKNWGDEATLSNIWVKSSKATVKICQWSQGNANGEPSMLGDGPSPPLCQYSESDVHINGDVSQAGGSTPSTGSTAEGSSAEQAPGTVSPASSGESNDEGGSSTSQNQWTQPAFTLKSSGSDTDKSTDTPSTSDGEAPSQSSEDNKSDDDDKSKSNDDNNDNTSKSDDVKSDDDNSDSTQQQESSPDSDSVTQSEVAGEAGAWNQSSPTAVDAESATKQTTMLTSTTPTKKCNIRRKRN